MIHGNLLAFATSLHVILMIIMLMDD